MKVAAIIATPSYPRLKQYVIEHTGLAYYEDKDRDLAERILQRLEIRGLTDCASYLHALEDGAAGEEEMDELIGELTIGETYFFRQPEQFEALRQTVFPDLIERNRSSRRLRIWSAGCATGAEPYSIALLLANELAELVRGWDVTILGTDIDREFIARARAATYDNWAFRGCPKDFRTRHFELAGKRWVLRPSYRNQVTFQRHNLVKDPIPAAAYDLVLCRNVMIYFSPEIVRATADRLFGSLAEGGWLLVGHAELSTEVFRAFRTVNLPGVTLYQKAGATAPVQDVTPPRVATQAAHSGRGPARGIAAVPIRDRNERPKPAPASPDVQQVRQLADSGQWDEAAACCGKLLEADSLNPVVHFTFALILEHTGAQEAAEQSLRRAIYLNRSFALAHYHLGLLLRKKNDIRRAKKAFENVIELAKRWRGSDPVEHAEVTVAELRDLAKSHLDLLGKA